MFAVAARQLLGRTQELESIESFLDRCNSGPAELLIEGDPGIGKTTLWQEARQRAEGRGIRVLSCRAAEAEAKLSFSALSDLLEPLPNEALAALPAPQRRALDVALLRADPQGAPPDARAVATAFRSVLTWLATTPVLVAIDDIQWLDRSSARAVEFAFHRRGDTPLALLVSSRPSRTALTTVLSDAEVIVAGPLSLGAIHELLKGRLGRSLPRPLLLRIHDAAQGNPFYALEIAREALRTDVQPGDPLPVPKDLSEIIRRRVARLTRGARDALLVAALLGEPDDALISAALDSDAEAGLDQAEAAGIIERRQGAVRFSHPLFAEAVRASATRPRRRQLHHRLADVVQDPEQRGRHLALAAERPDSIVARLLDEAAAAARARGALDAAAELTEHAVRLTPSDQVAEANERSLQLGLSLRLAGDTERAHDVLEQLCARASGPALANALVELAAVLYWTEGALAAVECCERMLEASGEDPGLRAKAHADLAVYCDFDLERSYRHAQAALELFEAQGDAADRLAHAESLGVFARGSLMLGRGLPMADLDRAIKLESKNPEASEAIGGRLETASGQWLKYVDDFDSARARLESARHAAMDEGDESALPNILMHLAQTELWSGNWTLASRYADESCAIAEQLGQTFGGPPAYRALVEAHLGHADEARRTAVDGLEIARRNPLAAPMYLRVLGFLDLSLGDIPAAQQHLTQALQHMKEVRLLEPAVLRIHADAVEALVAGGELDRAAEVLAPWEQQARGVGIPWSLATSMRCRSLVTAAHGHLDRALAETGEALVVHERLPMPFELGRTLLARGQIERRGKHKAAAKASLESALAIFDRLGAPLWTKKAQAELARIGLRRAASDELTEGERRVAELAASGLTNREVAAQLFMSPKTVEANLSRAYRKLDIHSRAELGARLAGEGSARAQT
jgi:DNA-binding CsgD family transcriptional regulator